MSNPYAYRVEYVRGASKIQTNYIPTNRDIITSRFKFFAEGDGPFSSTVGSWDADPNYWLRLKFIDSKIQLWAFSPFQNLGSSDYATDTLHKIVIDLPNKSVLLNDVPSQITVGTEHLEQPPLAFFVGAECALYDFRVQRDGETIVDIVPVEDFGGTPCLYDRVSGETFYSTGDLIAGPRLGKGGDCMIANRFNPLGRRYKHDAKSYIQPGLIGMWDGIENIGFGKHDDNAAVWKDLVGNFDFNIGADCVIGSNCISRTSSSGSIIGSSAAKMYGIKSVEVVFRLGQTPGNALLATLFANAASYYRGAVTLMSGRDNIITCRLRAVWGDAYGRDIGTVSTVLNKASFLGVSSETVNDLAPISAFVFNGEDNFTGNTYSTGWVYSTAMIGGDVFVGDIFAVRVYDSVRTKEQMLASMAIDKERFGI